MRRRTVDRKGGAVVILTGRQIEEAVEQGRINIDPFDPASVQPASYDLHVGPEGYTSSRKDTVIALDRSHLLALAPGDFGMVITSERLTLDSWHVGRFGLRSSLARRGLVAAVGPQIDPGFDGRLIVGLVNLSPHPIPLTYLDGFLTVEFHRLQQEAAPYSGPYQHRDRITGQDIEHFIGGQGMVYSEVVSSLSTLNRTVGELRGSVNVFLWLVGAAIAVLTIAVTVALVRG